MTAFADASAIVKLFAIEEGTEQVLAEPGPFAVSTLTRVECASALWRKERDGPLHPIQAHRLVNGMQEQFGEGRFAHGPSVIEAPLGVRVLERAARLCGVHALRAGDAIQLATALAVRAVDPACSRFWVFDQRLADAAAKEGFAVLGPDARTGS